MLRRTRQKELRKFEERVTITEEIYRAAMKSKKMYKKELKKQKINRSTTNNNEIQKAKSFVDILLSSENNSVDNIIKINSKQKIAEENCLRKINFFNPDQCKNTIFFPPFLILNLVLLILFYYYYCYS